MEKIKTNARGGAEYAEIVDAGPGGPATPGKPR